MVFDFASFIAGLAAGGLVGVLAGYLHETEAIGELQERVRVAMVRFDRIASRPGSQVGGEPADADLRRQLLELQDEIKKMYRRGGR